MVEVKTAGSGRPAEPEYESALAYAWDSYRDMAADSRREKKRLTSSKCWALFLTLTGAAFGIGAPLVGDLGIWAFGLPVPRIFGGLSALSIALAGYVSKDILKSIGEHSWIKARSASEVCKSEAYRFAVKSEPYARADACDRLIQKVDELVSAVQNLGVPALSDLERARGRPDYDLSADDYFSARIDSQITYFNDTAKSHARIVNAAKTMAFWLGGLSILLGAAGGVIDKPELATWVAFITTLTTAIGSFVFSERYEYLTRSYRATSRKLEKLKTQWNTKSFALADLVTQCEDILSVEAAAWAEELSSQQSEERKGAAGSGAGEKVAPVV